MRDHVSRTCKHYLYSKKCRCNKKKWEFQWLCNTRHHAGKCCRKEKSSCLFFLFRFCTAVHRKCRSRKSEDHKDKFTWEISGRICAEMCDICRISKLCKEDVLSSLYHLSRNFHCSTDCCLPEWHVKYVMKSERNQSSLNNTKNQGSQISASGYQSAKCINSILYNRPGKIHSNPNKHVHQCRNDRNKSGPSEEW